MIEHTVNIPAREAGSYRISIGTRILGSLWEKIEADFPRCSKFVVTDENLVSAGHLERLLDGCEVPVYVIRPAGEETLFFLAFRTDSDRLSKATT